MFIDCASKHSHWISACQRFAAANNVADIAHKAGLNPQTLRNKLNPDQPHELTVAELVAIIQACDGDETLFDGALLCCGLTAVAIPQAERAQSLPHQAISLNAQVASVSGRWS